MSRNLCVNTIVIVANLGHLKAYRLINTPTRGLKLELFEDMAFPEAHGRFADRLTDMAGRFPVAGSAGQAVQMSSTEALTAELETTKRLTKLVAEQIETILKKERPEWWDFAASADINQAIRAELPTGLGERIRYNVSADLTKTPPSDILSHLVLQ